MTVQLYLIGDPVAHSLSPCLHEAMLAEAGLDGRYTLRRVTAETLPAFMDEVKRDRSCLGFNVTMPLKQAVLPYLDELDDTARRCGAVNTVCLRAGGAIGHNTDGAGFVDSITTHGLPPHGKTMLLLGAGGAAEAVCAALADSGAAHIFLANRHTERAEAIARRRAETVQPIPFESSALSRAAAQSDLIVNATSLGMSGKPQFPDLAFLKNARRDTLVYDLVYQPRVTEFLETAAKLELRTVSGIDLLVCQAVRSFALFTAHEVDISDLYSVTKDILEG